LLEKIITLEAIDPIELFGVNNKKLLLISQYFPKLKIVSRGNIIKAIGEDSEILHFENKLNLMIRHFNAFNSLSDSSIETLMGEKGIEIIDNKNGDDILVYGNNGLQVKARTANQQKIVEACNETDMIFAVGPAGTGKTYTAVALAVRALKNREVKRIILTRPAVEAGENLGFLPGDLKEKLDPYLQPLYDALRDMLPAEKLKDYLETGIIQIAPLAFMRGRTLDKAFAILDEAQNSTEPQLKMFLTRMGKSAKFIITGDLTQIDLPKRQPSGLQKALRILSDVKGISIIKLDERDVIRHELVKSIIKAFEKDEPEETIKNESTYKNQL
jgi:phosphate starvation-inducible protein PhoH and related proteins